MGGSAKTSTHDVMTKVPQFPCSKLKMGTASVATPALSGHHHLTMVSMLVIVMPCCSTSLAKGTSQTNEQAVRYTVTSIMGLVLMDMVEMS
jgi:hypothetical protein